MRPKQKILWWPDLLVNVDVVIGHPHLLPAFDHVSHVLLGGLHHFFTHVAKHFASLAGQPLDLTAEDHLAGHVLVGAVVELEEIRHPRAQTGHSLRLDHNFHLEIKLDVGQTKTNYLPPGVISWLFFWQKQRGHQKNNS